MELTMSEAINRALAQALERRAPIAWEVAADADLDRVDSEARAEAARARSAGEAAPHPDPGSIYEDIFATVGERS